MSPLARLAVFACLCVSALGFGACAQPYDCGVNLACTCACEVCDQRADDGSGECVSRRTVENPVSVCGPLAVDDRSQCAAEVDTIVSDGAKPCTRKCELALRNGGGLDVISCGLTTSAENPRVISADDAECRDHPRIDLP